MIVAHYSAGESIFVDLRSVSTETQEGNLLHHQSDFC